MSKHKKIWKMKHGHKHHRGHGYGRDHDHHHGHDHGHNHSKIGHKRSTDNPRVQYIKDKIEKLKMKMKVLEFKVSSL